MMRICIPQLLSNPIVLRRDCINILSVEKPQAYFSVVKSLVAHDDTIVLGDGSTLFPHSCIDVLISPFAMDTSCRKLQTALYAQLEKCYFNGDFLPTFLELQSASSNFLSALTAEVPLPIQFDEAFSLIDFMKLFHVRVENFAETLPEKLIGYSNTLLQLQNTRLFVLCSFRGFLSKEEWLAFLQHCEYAQTSVLLVEPRLATPLADFEIATIVDEDLCDFIAKAN